LSVASPELETSERSQHAVARVAANVALHDVRLSLISASIECDPQALDVAWYENAILSHYARVGEKGEDWFSVWVFFSLGYRLGTEASGPVDVQSAGEDDDTESQGSARSEEDDDENGDEVSTHDVDIRLVFDLHYHLHEPSNFPDDEELDAFAKINSVFNAWPYWRELAQSTSVRMGIPPIVIPLLTVRTVLEQGRSKVR
jgi:hypothetical protein